MRIIRRLWFAALIPVVAVATGEPDPLWTSGTVEHRIGEIEFRECSLTYNHRTRFLECARLTVPEDYSDPGGRRIALFIGRLPARSANNAADPLLAIEGGPGAASSQSFLWLDRALGDLAARRDIYLIDQRGTGLSGRRDCELDAAARNPVAFDVEAARAAGRRCLRRFDGDPRRYTTSVAVKDFEAVREALGIEAWNLYGTSYGTRVVQHYMRRHPAAVRTATLDAVIPPTLNLGPDIALHSQAALDALFARCDADPVCRRRFPGLKAGVENLMATFDKQARNVTYRETKTGNRETVALTRGHVVAVIRMMLYRTDMLSVLPLILHRAYAGEDFAVLAATAVRIEQSMTDAIALGMHNAVVCSEDVPYYTPQTAGDAAATYMGVSSAQIMKALCTGWPVGVVDADLKQPLESDIPALLLSGEYDPITPPAYAERAAAGLTRSRHLVAPGQGHGVGLLGCIPRIIADFVDTADTGALQTGCVSRLQAARPFVNVNGPVPGGEEPRND